MHFSRKKRLTQPHFPLFSSHLMKNFTYLANNINLSIFNAVITLYPLSDKIDSQCATCLDKAEELGIGIHGYVSFEDSDHGQYHTDGIDQKIDHYHVRFGKPINKNQLDMVLRLLESFRIISTSERDSILSAYDMANVFEESPCLSCVGGISPSLHEGISREPDVDSKTEGLLMPSIKAPLPRLRFFDSRESTLHSHEVEGLGFHA